MKKRERDQMRSVLAGVAVVSSATGLELLDALDAADAEIVRLRGILAIEEESFACTALEQKDEIARLREALETLRGAGLRCAAAWVRTRGEDDTPDDMISRGPVVDAAMELKFAVDAALPALTPAGGTGER